MTASRIADVLAAEALAVEAAESSTSTVRPLSQVKVTRGHSRARTLQVRLNDDELADLEALASQRGLPPSTVARSILMAALRPAGDFAAALDRIEADVHALRGKLQPA